MKKQVKNLKKILLESKEDLQYLLTVGVPSGVLMVLLNQCRCLGEVY